uniref:Receptor-like serine/threonine-protein kinase n=1 Tax=Leersia perrieri TaxID=77586 RepID=A0A0D9VVN7_9ORYZ
MIMMTWPWRALPPLAAGLLLLLSSPAASIDTITVEAPLEGNRTLVSAGGTFALGFFDAAAGHTYLGIWYNNIPARTVVWVANRRSPVVGSVAAAELKIDSNGSLAIVQAQRSVVWVSPGAAGNATALLLDNGNLVLRFAGGGVAWQSFDYPTDTLLPGMKLGVDLRTGLDRYMSSWRLADDPSPGEYTFRIDTHGSPEFFLYRWSMRTYGSGPWNGYQFSGVPNLRTNTLLSYQFMSTAKEAYYQYDLDGGATVLTRFVMNSSGQIQRLMWIDTTRSWSVFSSYPMDECEAYRACGAYGVCNVETSPMCGCPVGFEPRYPQAWALRDGSGGCIRRTPLNCTGDGFAVARNMKLPESANATVDMALGLEECRLRCLSNCACRAYASANVTSPGAKGCFMWTGDLLDMRRFDNGGQDLFIRLAASDLPTNSLSDNSQTAMLVSIIVPSVVALLLLLGGLVICVIKVKDNKKAIPSVLNNGQDTPFGQRNHNAAAINNRQVTPIGRRNHIAATNDAQDNNSWHPTIEQGSHQDLDLPSFDVATILYATSNFSSDNKLGQGGFGPVYMGRLDNGQDIAVKRLSRRSTQGLREFKNEVKLIAKLQHRNLVRLLGCCIDGSERMLVYEYMHNRSLNTFLFNEEKQSMLNWAKRFNIINGIARGILYLHQDSALRIIHRDLKASNILLDRDMNPKISDFGVARIFGTDQTTAYTKKVVGTYGYMSPEYAMDGVFSMKSDVFSFGVLVLEIVSGKKNRGFYHNELDLNLLRYAWRLWKEGRSLEFLDQSIVGTSSNVTEVLRCIQIGLLCVQEQPRHRPTMSAVTLMLGSESPALHEPCEPAFSTGRSLSDDTEASRSNSARSWTATAIEGR